MGITSGQLRKLGFKIKNRVYQSDDDSTLVYYDTTQALYFFIPRGKKVIFFSNGVDAVTGEPLEVKRLVYIDEIGYFEMLNFLRSLKRVQIKWPRNLIIE